MPQSRAIAVANDTNSQWSSQEQMLLHLGQREIADLIRTLRLQNPYPLQSPEYLLWNDQCQLNIPLLLHACLYLHHFCIKHRKNRVLFTARDGCLWIQLFQILYPQYESIYFHTSRFTYSLPTPSFIEYVRGLYTGDTVIVDAQGTGRTCERFFRQYLHVYPIYLSIINSSKKRHGIIRTSVACELLEQLNYDLTGALYDVREGEPLRSCPEYDLRFIRPSHACIAKCTQLLADFTLPALALQVIQSTYQVIKLGLVLDRFVCHAKAHWHVLHTEGHWRHIHELPYGRLFEP